MLSVLQNLSGVEVDAEILIANQRPLSQLTFGGGAA